jgi:prolipoprotein diacylglyceryl transferase
MISALQAYFPSPPRGVWHLGPVPVRAYALCIIVGIVAALVIGDRRWVARGGERGVIYDIALWAVPFGLVGGRLYHLLTDWRTYFGSTGAGVDAALRIWDGGLGIWGAVALGGVGAWIGCRRLGIPLPAFGDAVAPGIVLAQGIGRLGNYFNQELYGRETTVPWGMKIYYRLDPSGIVDVHSLDGVSTGQVALVVHPTFLYELLWDVLVFVVLIYLDRRFTIGHGRLFALYVAGYCIGRFCVELLRDDPATMIAEIRVNSFTSTFVFIGAVVYFLLAPKGRESWATLRRTWAEKESGAEPEAAEAEAEPVGAAESMTPDRKAGPDEFETEAGEAEDTAAGEAGEAEEADGAEAGEVEDTAAGEAGEAEETGAGEADEADEAEAGEAQAGEAGEAGEAEETGAGEAGEAEDTEAGEAEDTAAGEAGEAGEVEPGSDEPESDTAEPDEAEPAEADSDEPGSGDAESEQPESDDSADGPDDDTAGTAEIGKRRWWRRRRRR